MSGLGKVRAGSMMNTLFDTAHIYVSLHNGDPGTAGSGGTEASGGSYAAVDTVPADWNSATNATPPVVTNANTITFPTATASWGTATFAGLWTHATTRDEANYIGSCLLSQSYTIPNAAQTSFPAGTLTFTLSRTTD